MLSMTDEVQMYSLLVILICTTDEHYMWVGLSRMIIICLPRRHCDCQKVAQKPYTCGRGEGSSQLRAQVRLHRCNDSTHSVRLRYQHCPVFHRPGKFCRNQANCSRGPVFAIQEKPLHLSLSCGDVNAFSGVTLVVVAYV